MRFGRFVMVIACHSTLRVHLYTIVRMDSDGYPFCCVKRETSLHFLGKYNRYVVDRLEVRFVKQL